MIVILASAAFVLASWLSPQNASASSRHAAAADSGGSFDQLAQSARRARDDNRDDAAMDLYRRALKIEPGWDEGLWYLGTLLYEKENYPEASAVLQRFLTRNPKSGKVCALLGLIEFETHAYAQALDHLQKSKTLGLGNDKEMSATVSYITAILLTRSGKFNESLNLLSARVESGEDSSALAEPIGLAALHMPFLPNEIPAARRELVRLTGAGVIAVQTQRYGDADKLFSALETAYPDQPEVHFLIGSYLMQTRPDDGILEMKREIEISPSHVPARIRLAEEYIRRQNIDDGIEFAAEAVRLAPADPLAHEMLGEALIAKGDSVKGIGELETARDSLPGDVRIHWDLVRAYAAAGRSADVSREKAEIERLSRQDAVQ